MIKTILLAVWVGALTLGASTGVVYALRAGLFDKASGPRQDIIESRKTRSVQVPVLVGGVVQGYVVAQFVYTASAETLKRMTVPPDSFVLDEALRLLYGRSEDDPRNLKKLDLEKMARQLVEKVNARLGEPAVRDILVHELTYVSNDPNKK